MTFRIFRRFRAALCLLVLPLGLGAQPAGSGTVPAASLAIDNDLVGPFNWAAVPLDSILQLVEQWTGRTIIRPPSLPAGDYYFVRHSPLPKSEALLAIETMLSLNQIGLVPTGDAFIKVVPIGNVRAESPPLLEGSTLGMPPSGRAATKIFSLQFLRVREFLPEIAPLLNPQYGGAMPFEKANAALITDSISTLQRIETLINQLDRPVTAGLTPKLYTIEEARASDLVNKINSALGNSLRSQLGSATTFTADDRTNQIILVADPSLHDWFGDLIDQLDVRADPNTRNDIIALKHAIAIDVAPIISDLVSGRTQAAPDTSLRPGEGIAGTQGANQSNAANQNQQGQQAQQGPNVPGAQQPLPGPGPVESSQAQFTAGEGARSSEFSSLITILADERSNSLVVSGTVDDIRLIRELVDKLDIVLAQVRIEAVIVEVTLGDSDTTGIDALGLQVVGDKLVGFSVNAPSFAIGDGEGGFAGMARPGSEGFISGTYDLAGIIRLTTTPRKNRTNILSAPSILTAHNKEGIIFVGEERPVISGFVTDSGASAGTSRATNVQTREIGITLTVTPLIGTDGSVELTISQEVKDVVDTITIDGNEQPVVGSRRTESVISADSGEIIVLGGLQRVTDIYSTNRLGPIPIIGDLLGHRTKSSSRTDLVFFLRPVVVTNTAKASAEALQRVEGARVEDDLRRLLDLPPAAEPASR